MHAYKHKGWTQDHRGLRACAGGGVGTTRARSVGEEGDIRNALNKEF